MKKDDLVYIGHMLELSLDAIGRLNGRNQAAYNADDNLRLAITHLIQTIGEAARKVSSEFRTSHPEIPWTIVVGMRHRFVHDYIHVDYETVWETATQDLPVLIPQLEAILGE